MNNFELKLQGICTGFVYLTDLKDLFQELRDPKLCNCTTLTFHKRDGIELIRIVLK